MKWIKIYIPIYFLLEINFLNNTLNIFQNQKVGNPKYISDDTNLVKRESDLEYYDQIFHDGNHDIDDPDESPEELINLLDRDEDYSDRNLEMNHSVPQVEDMHNVLKRSVCKPNQEFQSECNACKCAADGLSYTCSHNECMEGETNREVEVFMENEVSLI